MMRVRRNGVYSGSAAQRQRSQRGGCGTVKGNACVEGAGGGREKVVALRAGALQRVGSQVVRRWRGGACICGA